MKINYSTEENKFLQGINRTLVYALLSSALMGIFSGYALSQSLLKAPQKAVYDEKRNRILISNYDSGDIIQIDSIGTQSYFVKNANFVDGLEIVGDTILGVGNNREVRGYSLETKALVMKVTLSGSASQYLSSITYDSAGHLFVSCPRLNAIYKVRISDGAYWIFAVNNGLNKPNGILLEKENNRIVILDDSPSGIIHQISLKDSTVRQLMKTNFNSPDGIVRDKYGSYYIGGYYLKGIYKIDSKFSKPPTLFYKGSTFVYPTYIYKDHSILVTNYGGNSWERIYLEEEIDTTVIKDLNFNLYQNYPNPFNPVTVIRYKIPIDSNVSMILYDILGNEVAVMVDKEQAAGDYNINFSLTDHLLAGGVYFYKLQANDYQSTRKMVLLK